MPSRLSRAKFAYTTRTVDRAGIAGLLTTPRAPRSGDLVLARIDAVGQHQRIELTDSRRARLFEGDTIVVCYGSRYAPDQFEAEIPADLGACQLVAAGGVAAAVVSWHDAMDEPTQITPIGLLAGRDGLPLNLAAYALARRAPRPLPPVLAVAGTAMNAGKTTAAAYAIRGLAAAGLRVGAAKVTGTGAGGDRWLMHDAGAAWALDFTDCGVPSTYRLAPAAVERVAATLVGELAARGAEAIVLEVADGVYQQETARLLGGGAFTALVDAVLFAAGDAAGAALGVAWLRERGLPVAAVAGALTRSPLACREAALACGLPVLDIQALAEPATLLAVLPALDARRAPALLAA